MNRLIFAGRAFYASALLVYGIQQLYFGTFRDVFFSPYQQHLPLLPVWSGLFGLYLIATGVYLFIPGKGKQAALLLGAVWTVLFLGAQLSYQLISQPNKLYHLGLWTAPLKELALAGGAFIVASSFRSPPVQTGFINRLMPYGNLFFLYTISSFGVSHLVYTPVLAATVPAWVANPVFWTVLTGITLTAGGIALILGFRIRIISLLLSLKIFLWVWLVHVPGTLSNGFTDNRGDLLASTFDALAFSGSALLMGLTMKGQHWVQQVEKWGEENSYLKAT
ncbi:hypothetical protein C7T94_13980 [Pedobacter yulinensis]|uniref:DoxX family protein n=1 Tax=Pedobacter yulinensis TaxID=2126353 RepID=A0A2T3HMP6_9SPHI|nr:hypothetical protein [Pedobacter yulinensis]PST83641.1 hypothetical protein C7T94_13980 [Pedobacter yulinensis]